MAKMDARISPGPLNVLVVGMHYAPEPTGNAPYTTGMARALAAEGHRVRVITGYPHYPQWKVAHGYRGLRIRELDGDVPVTRLRHPVPSPPTARGRIVMDLSFAAHAATVNGGLPDVVIAVSPALLTVASALRWRRRGRTALGVVTQDLYSRALRETGMTGSRTAAAAAALERALLNRADGIAVVHENFARSLAELGVAGPPVTVIRNWTHTTVSHADPATTRRRLGWSPGQIIALHAGNMGVKQGLDNLINAARRSDEAGGRIRFVLLGDGAERARLETAAAGVSGVSFMDPLPSGEFEDALAAADVLVLNEAESVLEMSAPSKLTSYFAAAGPVVAATHAASAAGREIQRSGGGVRVDPGDPIALYEAVRSLGSDPGRARAIGALGRDYAERHLTAGSAARAYCDWVVDLARSRVPARAGHRLAPPPATSVRAV